MAPEQPGRGRSGLSNWPLRAKLVAAFALPTVAALFLAGLRVYDGVSEYSVYERAQQRVELSKTVARVSNAVQAERESMAAWIVSSRPVQRGELDADIANTQRATAQLRSAEGDVAAIDDEATSGAYQQALTRLDSLGKLRDLAREGQFPASAAVISYVATVDVLLEVSAQFDTDISDRGLQNRHEALTALARAKEYSAQQNTYLREAAIRGSFDPAELQSINNAEPNLVSAMDQFSALATPENRLAYTNTVTGPAVSQRFQLQQLALQRAEAGLNLSIDPTAVARSSAATADLIRGVQVDVLEDEGNYAGDLLSSVQRELIITSAILLAGLLLALILMFVVARSLLRPLRGLRRGALEVAERHLPQAVDHIMSQQDPQAAAEQAVSPVPVHTTEEIGQVARAFDVVHEQAVRLATEQALLRENVSGIFVNLSRRSQRLVERQLGVIDRLEADEQDPDQLASLFELDHLATRLRRNGESLLVLSGAGLAKSVPKPVRAADVIGAAVSEIEQYARVEVGAVPDIAVQGLTIHDLVHVMAELLDNATYFSEPETTVAVRAAVTKRKALAIQITDRGVGMGDEQIAEANARLADPPDLDVSVTRRMGLYVVARLAKRHGIEVRLRENEDIDGGVIARVVVPAQLLTDPGHAGPQQLPGEPAAGVSATSMVPVQQVAEHSAGGLGGNPPVGGARRANQVQDSVRPMDSPMSLDDLVGESAGAAGPFRSAHAVASETTSTPTPTPPAPEPTAGANVAAGSATFGQSLPKRQPSYGPNTPDPAAQQQSAPQPDGALEEDVPTKRLPIYQSVLSRWFSASDAGPPAGTAQSEMSEHSASTPADTHESSHWHSASDDGWRAAHSLLEDRDEGVTTAGLPKRVPNAYLVPGSVGSAEETDVFRDDTAGAPSPGAVARSASATRDRMASFQRGYTSGRHTLAANSAAEQDSASTQSNGSAQRSSTNGAKERE